ncbi:peptidase M28-like protein [Archangium gephyra]|uniref:Aminopeptidase Y n=1 Tax=Archangium gephyra TaxID=48 RepID=A0AAC8QAV7_9BACT|nr:M28 family peptidase [Archangium gephyra]AKJ04233.1 Aminopeptidase Y [Archangium gephyra]REG37687.1 peptidase M28-like protein [Archangium gephyra]
MRALRATLLLLAVNACASRVPVEEPALLRAGDFGAGVEQARLESDVAALAAAHLADTPLDCGAFDLEQINLEHQPVCHITREKARQLVQERFESLGYTVTSQDAAGPVTPTTNVIAELKGTTHPDEVVVVGAHYDSFYAGADDNSSGVAAMLEMARLAAGKRFARTVRFVGFDMEELGLAGSTRYVRTLAGEEIVASIIFDCIGYKDARPGAQLDLPGFPIPNTGDFVAAISNEQSRPRLEELYALGSRLDFVPIRGAMAPSDGSGPFSGNLMRSDHAPFWLAGYNSLFLTDTANFRNPHYHTDKDVPSTLDYAFLAGVTRLSAAGIAYWAEGPLP